MTKRLPAPVLAAALLALAPSTRAQTPVIDVRAILQAEQQVSQGLTQIQRLEAQLSNQALMLRKMQTDITAPVAQITGQATQILQQAQGIGFGAQNVAQQYASLYPQAMPGASLTTTQASLAAWRRNNVQALQSAMQLQNQIAQGHAGVSAQVATAISASQAAPGQTAAIQATNQLLATVTGQLTQLQALLITQARAEQTGAAQMAASQAAGDADSARFWARPPTAVRLQNTGKL